jgi:hypothetical protein
VALHAPDPTDEIPAGGLASRFYESDTQRHLAEPRSSNVLPLTGTNSQS